MSTSSKMTCPLSGVSKPPKIRSVVVFPHPDGIEERDKLIFADI